ncbi:MAG: hypothetical protein FJ405_17955 [Verrucomicrobia bacterium]|nr:hypothetical protein [Verrucomicrobiota bacterium]
MKQAGPHEHHGGSGKAPTHRALGWLRSQTRKLSPKECVVLNLGACPGLGTVIARARFGWVQLIMSVSGFLLAMCFLTQWLAAIWRGLGQADTSLAVDFSPFAWQGWTGFGLFFASWILSAFSTRSILNSSGRGDSTPF